MANMHLNMLSMFAILFTALFFLHFLATLFLGDGHDDIVAAGSDSLESLSSGFSIFSLFTLAGMLSGISIALWTYLLRNDTSSISVVIAVAAGVATSGLYGCIRKWIRGLDSPGLPNNFTIEKGDEGVVYIKIHGNGKKGGQAYFDKHHQRRTFDAITEESEPIVSSSRVVVVDVIGTESDTPTIKVKTLH